MPNGFAITAQAYRYLLDDADAWPRLHAALDGLDVSDVDDLARRAQLARDIVYEAAMPVDLIQQITAAYRQLLAQYAFPESKFWKGFYVS